LTAVQESGNGGEMVRTKRTTGTLAGRQRAKRDAEGDESVMTIGLTGESLQDRQHCAFAKVFEDALFGDALSKRLVAKRPDDPTFTHGSESTGRGFSQAAAWAAEPEWIGEASEETAETVTGGREPEQ
jgi:hypothetical protein